MSDAKHTLGPWMIGEDQSVDETWSIVTTSGGSIIANVNDRHDRRANAHLIAAAPDLLAALIEAADPIGGYMHGPALERARAAIAKARGKDR
jgi:hypothetical protein